MRTWCRPGIGTASSMAASPGVNCGSPLVPRRAIRGQLHMAWGGAATHKMHAGWRGTVAALPRCALATWAVATRGQTVFAPCSHCIRGARVWREPAIRRRRARQENHGPLRPRPARRAPIGCVIRQAPGRDASPTSRHDIDRDAPRSATRSRDLPTTAKDPETMRFSLLLLPLALLGLSGCIDVHEHPPAHHDTTVVAPAPNPPPTVYAPPGSSTTVVTHP